MSRSSAVSPTVAAGAHGRDQGHTRGRGIGYDYLHVAIDDRTRVAYVEIHADERGVTCAAFTQRASAWFADHGVTIKRVITDNALAYCHSRAFQDALADLTARHKRTRPYRPQTNGKACEHLGRRSTARSDSGQSLTEVSFVRSVDPGPVLRHGAYRPDGSDLIALYAIRRGVGLRAVGVADFGELAFEAAQGFVGRLGFGDLAVVVPSRGGAVVELVAAVRQQPQHGGVVLGGDASQIRVVQRGGRDRGRVGVVGLASVSGVEHADSGGEFGGHVDDVLAAGDQLLGEQPAEPVGAFDGPSAVRPLSGPRSQRACRGLLVSTRR
jgi:hypothetical protein